MICSAHGTIAGKVWSCPHEVKANGLCGSHYRQSLRRPGDALKPLRPRAEEVEHDAQVTFRLPSALKDAAESAAQAAGLDVGEWWRRAGAKATQKAPSRR